MALTPATMPERRRRATHRRVALHDSHDARPLTAEETLTMSTHNVPTRTDVPADPPRGAAA